MKELEADIDNLHFKKVNLIIYLKSLYGAISSDVVIIVIVSGKSSI